MKFPRELFLMEKLFPITAHLLHSSLERDITHTERQKKNTHINIMAAVKTWFKAEESLTLTFRCCLAPDNLQSRRGLWAAAALGGEQGNGEVEKYSPASATKGGAVGEINLIYRSHVDPSSQSERQKPRGVLIPPRWQFITRLKLHHQPPVTQGLHHTILIKCGFVLCVCVCVHVWKFRNVLLSS